MTDREALEASIEHWAKDYKKLRLFGGDEWFGFVFSGAACALCDHYLTRFDCGGCPLVDGGDVGCRINESPYCRAEDAHDLSDKPAFMAARAALLKRMKRALAKITKGK